MARPVLSVVVPTHNRSQYALSCIEAVLRIADNDVQLVVSDTSDDGRLQQALAEAPIPFLEDKRFKYVKLEGASNLTKNHNDALTMADGEYVTVIGDDDCITHAALEAARWARLHNVTVVSQTVSANYAWPDFRSRMVGRGHAGRLYVPRKRGGSRWRSGPNDLRQALTKAFQTTESMPRCYHGVVKRDLLERARTLTGAYFHGSSPDMSGAVLLANLVDRYVEVDVPLTLPGASGGSNSGRSAMNTHKGELAAESQTNGFSGGGWVHGVPKFFSVETVWAHAGLATLEKLSPDLIPDFNFPLLIALCSARHPEFSRAIDGATAELSQYGEDVRSAIQREIVLERARRVRYLLRRSLLPTAAHGRKYFGGLSGISAASEKFAKYSQEAALDFSLCVAGIERQ